MDRHRLLLIFVAWMVISAGFTSWEGHLGGLLTGGLLGAGLAHAPRRQRLPIQAGVLVATTIALAVLTVWKSTNLTVGPPM
jgi:membrane associated rhomboid family serine protease